MAQREVIQTIKQNCRRCYSCVRECPARAIRIVEGQASVVPERCVACGNCTTVCALSAKTYLSGLEHTLGLLRGEAPVAALLAPSFPAEFSGIAPETLVGALKAAGFHLVVEVAYGADLVNQAYRDHLAANPPGLWITSSCPAAVDYVLKYHPGMATRLLPVVSPLLATAQAVKAWYGPEVRCVFLGPCIAKKREIGEVTSPSPAVDEALTFQEVWRLLEERRVRPGLATPASFDPPRAGDGRLYPFAGGLLRSAGLANDLTDPAVMVVSGHRELVEALHDLERHDPTEPLLVEALMCRGCHAGPGVSADGRRLASKNLVKQYVKQCETAAPSGAGGLTASPTVGSQPWQLPALDLHRTFVPDDQRLPVPTEQEIRAVLARTNKFAVEDELNCGACGYPTCREKAKAVLRGLAEEAMCLPFVIEQAERVCHELKVPWRELRDVHRHLINTEKLASMGQLAAGVAHELNNPLGTLLLYTGLLARKLREREDLQPDLCLLTEEAQRCKKIVAGLLDFARQNRVSFRTVELGGWLQHLLEGSFPAGPLAEKRIGVQLEPLSEPLHADLDTDQLTQVLVNLIQNGIESMEERGGRLTVSVAPVPGADRVRFSVADQGSGIPPGDRDRIFQPFFTTKGIGKGTGLGLSITYGIVKMHRGTIWFESQVGVGTVFHVELPRTQAQTRSLVV